MPTVKPHAVTAANVYTFACDCNGNPSAGSGQA